MALFIEQVASVIKIDLCLNVMEEVIMEMKERKKERKKERNCLIVSNCFSFW